MTQERKAAARVTCMAAEKEYTAEKRIIVIGGGAAGLVAAIGAGETLENSRQAADHGDTVGAPAGSVSVQSFYENPAVLVLDAGRKPGAKIYATGNGRCNLTNFVQNETCYYTDGDTDPYLFMQRFGSDALREFFLRMGVRLHDRNGYVYPATDQAGTIVQALLHRLRQLKIPVLSDTRVTKLEQLPDGGFAMTAADGRNFRAERVILAAGGRVSKAFACDGSGYEMARQLGHSLIAQVPALCSLTSPLEDINLMAGVRAEGSLTLTIDGQSIRTETGEIQLTDYGVSGIPAFQVSRIAGRALKAGRKVSAILNFLPEFSDAAFEAYRKRKLESLSGEDCVLDILAGAVNDRIAAFLYQRHHLIAEKKLKKLGSAAEIAALAGELLSECRRLVIPIDGTNGYDKAQVTAGGIPLDEVDPDTMESKITPGLYLAGEILDVDGICGGYNLTFAMCTGYEAGCAAAKKN
ncbi:hypothetical protein SAMN02745687_00579 [Lachnospiraceae bacterium NK3A20]|nr:hypothetical protein SAMN02745687_00579 [Lachnospiraceae bacterium NK3A20]